MYAERHRHTHERKVLCSGGSVWILINLSSYSYRPFSFGCQTMSTALRQQYASGGNRWGTDVYVGTTIELWIRTRRRRWMGLGFRRKAHLIVCRPKEADSELLTVHRVGEESGKDRASGAGNYGTVCPVLSAHTVPAKHRGRILVKGTKGWNKHSWRKMRKWTFLILTLKNLFLNLRLKF